MERFRVEAALRSQLPWFEIVRSGRKVGLWIHTHCYRSVHGPITFHMLDVVQRPVGAQTPPPSWLN